MKRSSQLDRHNGFWRFTINSRTSSTSLIPNPSLLTSAALRVSSTLDQDVENDAVLIDGAPEPAWLAGDRDDEVSGAEEFRPRALSEPDMILSYHPAPIVRPLP
jgi:hypothetical protein